MTNNPKDSSLGAVASQSEMDFTNVDAMDRPADAIALIDALRVQPDIQEIVTLARGIIAPRPGDRVLEIGCGTGENLHVLTDLAAPGGSGVGIDSSAAMIAEAKMRASREGNRVEFRAEDATNLSLPDAAIDCCWIERVLQHVAQPQAILNEASRVLVPGGRLLILDSDWDTLTIDAPDKETTRALASLFSDSIPHGWIGRQLPRLCRAAGLRVTRNFSRAIFGSDIDLFLHGLGFSEVAKRAESRHLVPPLELAAWLSSLEEMAKRDELFYSVTMFGVCAEKPNTSPLEQSVSATFD